MSRGGIGGSLSGGRGHLVRSIGRWFAATLGMAALTVVGGPPAALAGSASQIDWSGGAAAGGPVQGWDRSFSASDGISWLASPGMIVLSGAVREEPVEHTVTDSFEGPASLDAADLDGDGDLDLVGAAIGGGRIRWWRNEGGDPPSWTAMEIESGFAGASAVRAADVDGDGGLDIVGCAWTANEIAVWFNGGQGVSWTRQSIATGMTQCHWVDVADLDGDGDADLLAAAAGTDLVAVWYSDGGSPISWTMQVVDDAYQGARSLVPADLDADGDVDLLGAALDDDDLSWWRNDGGAPVTWTRTVISASFAGSHHADAWDMDLDGDLDIVAAGFGYPFLKIWWNDGGNPLSWREEDLGDAFLTPLVVAAADLDGEGDMDVAATSNNWHRVDWWRNTGEPPGDWMSATLGSQFINAWPLVIADLDGNGALDVISGASGATEVAWWRLTDFVESGVLESSVLSIPDHVVSLTAEIDADLPVGTEVLLSVRVGPSSEGLGDWTPLELGVSSPLMVRGPTLLQYRLELGTADPEATPIVRAVAFEWSSEPPARSSTSGRLIP